MLDTTYTGKPIAFEDLKYRKPNGQINIVRWNIYREPVTAKVIEKISVFCKLFYDWYWEKWDWDFLRNVFRLFLLEVAVFVLWMTWKGTETCLINGPARDQRQSGGTKLPRSHDRKGSKKHKRQRP